MVGHYILNMGGLVEAPAQEHQPAQRRAKHRRIDYYVSAAALAIINAQCKPQSFYDTSSVINRLIEGAGQSTAVLSE